MPGPIPRGNDPTEVRRAFQWVRKNTDFTSYATIASITDADYVIMYDTSEGERGKVLFSTFEASLEHDKLVSGTIVSHDTTATGAQLTSLTDNSMVDTLHRHSELSGSGGSPDARLNIDSNGNIGVNTTTQLYPFDIRDRGTPSLCQLHLCHIDADGGFYAGGEDPSFGFVFCGADIESGAYLRAKGTTAAGLMFANGNLLFHARESLVVGNQYSSAPTFAVYKTGRAAVGSGITDVYGCRFAVRTTSTDAAEAMAIDQNDADQAFIDFQGTSSADAANNISSWTGGATVAGYTKHEVNGVAYWIPYFNAPTGTSGELAELTELTDNSMVDSLHRHSELSSSDGAPDAIFNLNADGMMGWGTTSQQFPLTIRDTNATLGPQIQLSYSDRDYGGYLRGVGWASGASSLTLSSGMYQTVAGGWIPSSTLGCAMHMHTDASIRFYAKTGMVVGVSEPSLDATLQFWAAGNVSVGTHGSDPGSRFTVRTETDEGHEAVAIDQNDADQAFIDFQGTSAASAANNISTWVSGAVLAGFTLQEINGTNQWMPYYSAPTGAALATEYVPASVALNAGSNTAGDVDSVAAMLDSDTYDVDEVAATPGFDMEFTFSGVVAFTGVRVRCLYNGGASHTVELRLYNYDTTSWDTILEFTDQAYQTILEFPVLDDTNYISGGAAKLAIYHSSLGNAAHDISVDYVALTYGDEFSYPVSDHGNLSGLSDDDHTQYSLVAGTRAFTGTVSGVTPTADAHLATKLYVDDNTNPAFPAWETNSDGWSDVKNCIAYRWGRGRAQTTRNYTTFGSAGAGTTKWFGGCVGTNGKIYCAPRDATTVLEIDPSADTISTFGSISGSGKYTGCVLAPNGYIYCAPNDATNVLKIDTSVPSASTFGSVAAGSNKYRGCVLANNGMIYCIPFNTSLVLKIDPTSDSVSTFGTVTGSYIGGVLAPNGYIYGIPNTATTFLKIDPSADTESEVGSLSAGNKFVGGVLAPNGLIYCIPWDATYITILDTNDDSTRTISSFPNPSGDAYQCGCLGPDGMIYAAPFDNTSLLRIDPVKDTYEQWGTVSGGNKWSGLVLAPNGCMYGVPVDSATVLKLSSDISGGVEEDWYLSRHFNKF